MDFMVSNLSFTITVALQLDDLSLAKRSFRVGSNDSLSRLSGHKAAFNAQSHKTLSCLKQLKRWLEGLSTVFLRTNIIKFYWFYQKPKFQQNKPIYQRESEMRCIPFEWDMLSI